MKKILSILFTVICFSSFSQTRITAPIITNSLTDTTYSVTYDSLVKGGYRVLLTTGQRDSIPQAERKYGMLAYVRNTDSVYQLKSSSLDNSNWYSFKLGSSGSTVDTFLSTTGRYQRVYGGQLLDGNDYGQKVFSGLAITGLPTIYGDTLEHIIFATEGDSTGYSDHDALYFPRPSMPYLSDGIENVDSAAYRSWVRNYISSSTSSLQQVTTIGNSTNKGIRITSGSDTTISLNSDGSAFFSKQVVINLANGNNVFNVFSDNYPEGLLLVTDNKGKVSLGDYSGAVNYTYTTYEDSLKTITSNADNGYTFNGGNATFQGLAIPHGLSILDSLDTEVGYISSTDAQIAFDKFKIYSDGNGALSAVAVTSNKGKLDTTAADGVVTPTMLNLRVPYTGATTTLDMGSNDVNARSFKVNGTGGNGHIDLKWQSSNAPSISNSTALYADASGNLKWKNDGNYTTTIASSSNNTNVTVTAPNRSVKIDSITTSTTTAGLGFVKGNGTNITFDNTSYYSSADTGRGNTQITTGYDLNKVKDSLQTNIDGKLNISDTLTMLNGRIDAITLNSSGVIHNSPINFVRSGGGWTGTMSLANQSAYKLFGTGNSTSTPTFRFIDSNYFNGSFATQVRVAQNNYTEGTGISIASNAIANTLAVGLLGGQTVIGGTDKTDKLTLKSTSYSLATTGTDTSFVFRNSNVPASNYVAHFDNSGALYLNSGIRATYINNITGGTLSLGGFGTTVLTMNNTSINALAGIILVPNATNQVGLRITGRASQTADLLDIDPNGSTGGTYLKVDASGVTTAKKINIATGANASAGTATLSSGTITVNTTAVTANSIIMLTLQNCSNCGTPYISAKTAGTSFVISSTNVLDGSIVAYQIIN